MTTSWEELLTGALVGTERRGATVTKVAPDGTDLAAGGDSADAQILAAAAVLATWRRAGMRPAGGEPIGDPCPPDVRTEVLERSAQILNLLVNGDAIFGQTPPLIIEWLTVCDRAGFRLPHTHLPVMLDLATRQRELRAALLPCLDERGRWLAARRLEWRWAIGGPDTPVDWSRSTRNQRVADLQLRRSVDPDRARDLFAAHASGSPASERADLAEALEVGLSDADEAMLEALLDDRAKAVRAVAATLLDHLPTSRRAERLGVHLATLVSVAVRGHDVHVALPGSTVPAGLLRDLPNEPRRYDDEVGTALDEPPTGQSRRRGRQATLLQGIIAGAPLVTWTAAGARPASVVAMALARPEVLDGLIAATIAQHDRPWAEALFAALPLAPLVPVLDPDTVVAHVGRRLPTAGDHQLRSPLRLADALEVPWPDTLSRAIVRRLRKADPALARSLYQYRLAIRLHPSVAPDVERWIGELEEAEELRALHSVRQLHQTLIIRRTITEELA